MNPEILEREIQRFVNGGLERKKAEVMVNDGWILPRGQSFSDKDQSSNNKLDGK